MTLGSKCSFLIFFEPYTFSLIPGNWDNSHHILPAHYILKNYTVLHTCLFKFFPHISEVYGFMCISQIIKLNHR